MLGIVALHPTYVLLLYVFTLRQAQGERPNKHEVSLNTPIEKTKLVEVAAAVLQRPDGSFLLAQRPPDKIWPGYWEFPGGKIEPGETPYHALVRELREELGIEIITACPWLTRVFAYPHATVRLNFFRVTAWGGELYPHEGQAFCWQQPLSPALSHGGERGQIGGSISVSPMLPANAPILRALSLPDVYAISNVQELGEPEFMRRLQAALRNGLRLVQLREKNYSREKLRALACEMMPLMKQYGARLMINADVELAQEVGADGVQLLAMTLKNCAVPQSWVAILRCSARCCRRKATPARHIWAGKVLPR